MEVPSLLLRGVEGLLQAMVLPGLAAAFLLPGRRSLVQQAVLAVAVSLAFTHASIVLAGFVGTWRGGNPTRFLVTSLYDVLLVAVLASGAWRLLLAKPAAAEAAPARPPSLVAATLLFGIAAAFAVALAGEVGESFVAWDAVMSWQRWAATWAAGRWPTGTWEYPQLLPAMWAMTYAHVGHTHVHHFAGAGTLVLVALAVLAAADRCVRSRSAADAAGFVLAAWLLACLFPFGYLGYTDLPTAALCWMTAVAALDARDEPGRLAPLLVAAVLAGLSSAAKQSGLIIGGGTLAAAVWWTRGGGAARDLRRAAAAAAVFAASGAAWYGVVGVGLVAGSVTSALPTLAGTLHDGRGPVERLARSAWLLSDAVGYPSAAVVAAGTALAAALPGMRAFVLLGVLPYAALYALVGSYDLRNALPLAPVSGMAAGWGLGAGVAALSAATGRLAGGRAGGTGLAERLRRASGDPALALAVLLVLLPLSFGAAADRIRINGLIANAAERGELRQVAPDVNRWILGLARTDRIPQPAVGNLEWTSGWRMTRLPVAAAPFTPEGFQSALDANPASIVIVPAFAAPSVNQRVEALVAEGRYAVSAAGPDGAVLLVRVR